MFWVILGIFLLCLPVIIENINAKKETEQQIIESAYELFQDEELRALSKEEQEIAWDNAWEQYGKNPELQSVYLKVKDLIRQGHFSEQDPTEINDEEYPQEYAYGTSNNDDYEEDVEEVDVETQEILEEYENIAEEYEENEKYENCIDVWNKYIEIAKTKRYTSPQVEGYSQLGRIYEDIGNCEKAVENYSKAIKLAPEDKCNYQLRAYAYKELGEYNKCIEDYTKLIELTEDNASYYRSRAEFYCKLKKYQNAIEDYTLAIEAEEFYMDKMSDKTNGEILIATAGLCSDMETLIDYTQCCIRRYKYERGIAYYELQMYNEAIQDFEVITEDDRQYQEAREYLTMARSKKDVKYIGHKEN